MNAFELPLALRRLGGTLVAGFSDADFVDLCQHNPLLRLERTAQREIQFNFLLGGTAGAAAAHCSAELWHWNQQTQAGRAWGSSAGFELPDTSVRSPNASWMSRAAWERCPAERLNWFPQVCPQFVLEIKSPMHGLADVQADIQRYLTNGAQLGFLLDVEAETAYVYRPGQPMQTVQGYDQTLSGDPVLPGFALDLRPLRRPH